MDGTVKLVDWRGNIVPEDQAFWIENGKEFTPTPLEPAKKVVEIPFDFWTLHGLYIAICLTYFLWNYGLVGLHPVFLTDKKAAMDRGVNSCGYYPGDWEEKEKEVEQYISTSFNKLIGKN